MLRRWYTNIQIHIRIAYELINRRFAEFAHQKYTALLTDRLHVWFAIGIYIYCFCLPNERPTAAHSTHISKIDKRTLLSFFFVHIGPKGAHTVSVRHILRAARAHVNSHKRENENAKHFVRSRCFLFFSSFCFSRSCWFQTNCFCRCKLCGAYMVSMERFSQLIFLTVKVVVSLVVITSFCINVG